MVQAWMMLAAKSGRSGTETVTTSDNGFSIRSCYRCGWPCSGLSVMSGPIPVLRFGAASHVGGIPLSTAENGSLLENRKHVRHPGNRKAAVIYPGASRDAIMCSLADISDGGAGLIVADTQGIPDTFELQIKGEEIRRTCKVAWKAAPHRIGVAFT
jgi:hypothetical protein